MEGRDGRTEITPTDYSDNNNWMHIPEIIKPVDTIYIYPTVFIDPSPEAPDIVPIDNKNMRLGAFFVYEKQATVFEESTNVFAPYYRQTNLAALVKYNLGPDEMFEFQKGPQRADVFAALDYYFENYNHGRPFILAGHSQGSIMLIIVLKEYMNKHPEYRDRMVAAYPIGYAVTKGDLEEIPFGFAEGADDYNVIVSWNTEGAGNKGMHNPVVREGGISINPLNWSRGPEYVPKEKNIGSMVDTSNVMDFDFVNRYLEDRLLNEPMVAKDLFDRFLRDRFETKVIRPGIVDAKVDPERGVVLVNSEERYTTKAAKVDIFGPESYHGQDYGFFYFNLQENVKVRIEAYMRAHS